MLFVPVPQNHCKGGPQDLRTVTAAIQRLAHRNHRHPPHGHGCEVTRVASDAFSANMLLRAEACDLVLESIALAPALCESLFGRLLRLGTEKLSVFAFNAVVNVQWQCM